jgi:hypothetical protein
MIELSAKVINEIKKAHNENEIKSIINDAIAYLRKTDHYSSLSRRKFTFNLMVVLRYSKLKEHISKDEMPNLEKALNIIIELRKQDKEILF